MSKPLIAIICERWSSSGERPNRRVVGQLATYVDAVLGAGGLPVLFPLLPDPADQQALYVRVSGVVLPGGGDVDPTHYQAASHPTTGSVDPVRDAVELSLARQALAEGKPLLGICRGVQVLNVAFGGSLYQDLPSEMPAAGEHYFHAPPYALDHLGHAIQVEEDSLLARCLGTPIAQVNSRHHQAPRHAAPGLQVVARAPDGVIEALEVPGHPFALGVQWHPENLQQQPGMRAIFERFVQQAAAGRG